MGIAFPFRFPRSAEQVQQAVEEAAGLVGLGLGLGLGRRLTAAQEGGQQALLALLDGLLLGLLRQDEVAPALLAASEEAAEQTAGAGLLDLLGLLLAAAEQAAQEAAGALLLDRLRLLLAAEQAAQQTSAGALLALAAASGAALVGKRIVRPLPIPEITPPKMAQSRRSEPASGETNPTLIGSTRMIIHDAKE